MTSDDPADGEFDDEHVDAAESRESAVEGDADPAAAAPSEERSGRPLIAGLVGLLSGLAGGIAATTIAPGNVLLTVLLVVIVAILVTLGALRVLAR